MLCGLERTMPAFGVRESIEFGVPQVPRVLSLRYSLSDKISVDLERFEAAILSESMSSPSSD